MNKKAVVLLSGGLDSTTVLAIASSEKYECYALSFNYGQRHSVELESAKKIASFFKVKEHKIFSIDINQFGGSALTDPEINVPERKNVQEIGDDIPITYVPARNTIFLSVALGWAEVLGAYDIFIGANSLDYSGYPDCRPEYINAFEKLANLATKSAVEGNKITIHAPLLFLTKAEIIQKGLKLGVDYSMTFSCYNPDTEGNPCGRCDSCLLRKEGFKKAGLPIC